MRKIFPWMGLPDINDKELKSLIAVLLIKLREWRNLPHKRRSGNAAKLQKQMLFPFEVGKGNPLTIEIG